jgi:ATP-binding protein involved in chromosome partitioning
LTVARPGHIFKAAVCFIPWRALAVPPAADMKAPMDDLTPPEPTTAAPPTPDDVRGVLAGVLDPELHASIVDLGMVKAIDVAPDGVVRVKVALTTAGCPLRGQISTDVRSKVRGLPGVADVEVEYGEMTQEERSAVMQRARFQASQNAPPTEVASTTRVIAVGSGKGGVGKSSVTANLAAALAVRGLTVGVLDADIWGFSIPRMLGARGRLAGKKQRDGRGKIVPHEVVVARHGDDGAPGRLKVVSMGLLVDDEDTALMWRGLVLARALEQFLTDVQWGDLDYLLIDMPPGTGDIQMALARLLPQTEMLVVTTPAKGAQKVAARVADMARRSYLKVLGIVENMSEFVAPDGSRHAIFGSGGGKRLAALTGAPLVGAVPIEPEVSNGGDVGEPVVLGASTSAAAHAFEEIAQRIVDELLPPVEMAGCTARIFEAARAQLSPASS